MSSHVVLWSALLTYFQAHVSAFVFVTTVRFDT